MAELWNLSLRVSPLNLRRQDLQFAGASHDGETGARARVSVFRYVLFRKLGYVVRDSFRLPQVWPDSGRGRQLGEACRVYRDRGRRGTDEQHVLRIRKRQRL